MNIYQIIWLKPKSSMKISFENPRLGLRLICISTKLNIVGLQQLDFFIIRSFPFIDGQTIMIH